MALAAAPTFIRRATPQGTMDSLCAECLITVCTSPEEADIQRAEQDHVCDPRLLAYWATLSKPHGPREEP